jgi:hypothetical protein
MPEGEGQVPPWQLERWLGRHQKEDRVVIRRQPLTGRSQARRGWLTSVILATWEAEIGGSCFVANPAK